MGLKELEGQDRKYKMSVAEDWIRQGLDPVLWLKEGLLSYWSDEPYSEAQIDAYATKVAIDMATEARQNVLHGKRTRG